VRKGGVYCNPLLQAVCAIHPLTQRLAQCLPSVGNSGNAIAFSCLQTHILDTGDWVCLEQGPQQNPSVVADTLFGACLAKAANDASNGIVNFNNPS